MPAYLWIIIASWAVFLVIWFTSSFAAKRSASSDAWKAIGLVRVITILAVLLVFWLIGAHAFTWSFDRSAAPIMALAWIGAALTAIGIAFAAWARFYLGRNWGMPMSLREQPELVTTGPYALVRHPIYTGVILAVFGSTLASGPAWLIVFLIMAVYFVMSAKREEKDMLARFPDTYPAYEARTKMLVPFIF